MQVSKGQSPSRRESPEGGRSSGLARRDESSPFNGVFGLSPFAMMREFTDEMDRAFRRGGNLGDSSAWAPAIDVQQCGGKLVVSAELPGLKRDEVKVELSGDTLTIEGERKQEHKEDHQGFHRFERSYGRFYRSLQLPQGAQTDQVKAEMQDGLLKVSIPVPEAESKTRQIPIEQGATGSRPA